jgi:RimJ/RimL family protein N-acetyltransferase
MLRVLVVGESDADLSAVELTRCDSGGLLTCYQGAAPVRAGSSATSRGHSRCAQLQPGTGQRRTRVLRRSHHVRQRSAAGTGQVPLTQQVSRLWRGSSPREHHQSGCGSAPRRPAWPAGALRWLDRLRAALLHLDGAAGFTYDHIGSTVGPARMRSRSFTVEQACSHAGAQCDDVRVRELRTARLLLRPWSPEDADFLYDMESCWVVKRYIGAAPAVMTDRSQALASIERRRAVDHPVHGIWAIELLSERVPVGNLLLKPISRSVDDSTSPSEDVEIGWHLHPDYWGHGYASEAGSAGLAHAFGAGLPRVLAVTAPANEASRKVCRGLGMRHLGRTNAYYNAIHDVYQARRDEWRRLPA